MGRRQSTGRGLAAWAGGNAPYVIPASFWSWICLVFDAFCLRIAENEVLGVFYLVPRCLPQIALQSRKSGRQSRLFGIEPNKETRQSSKGYIH